MRNVKARWLRLRSESLLKEGLVVRERLHYFWTIKRELAVLVNLPTILPYKGQKFLPVVRLQRDTVFGTSFLLHGPGICQQFVPVLGCVCNTSLLRDVGTIVQHACINVPGDTIGRSVC